MAVDQKKKTVRNAKRKNGYYALELPPSWGRKYLKDFPYVILEIDGDQISIRPLEAVE
jgi:hypothetical protein